MKTTVEIPDELAARAKDVARQHSTTLRELVVAGLRSEVERRASDEPVDFFFPTFAGEGYQDGVGPGDLIRLAYEE